MTANPSVSSFLYGGNAVYLTELFARFAEDPKSVDATWQEFFEHLSDDARAALDEAKGASWTRVKTQVIGAPEPVDPAAAKKPAKGAPPAKAAAPDPLALRQATLDSLRAIMLIRAYRVVGHLSANLDPLGLEKPKIQDQLDPAFYGFKESDLDRPIFIDNVLGRETATMREIVEICRHTYCGSVGVEFMHIQDAEQKSWLQERIEKIENRTDFTEKGRRAIYEKLTEADSFERYLDKKYTGTKRFGLDGGEALIPALEQVIKRGGQLGCEEIVFGMAHRGRLNVLVNVMGKPYTAMFSEFQGNSANPDDVQGSGDVKYHLGTSSDREFDGIKVHLSLTANPSHLEVVNPVVVGKVRAKQAQKNDTDRTKVMGLLIHGDAAFAGQGLVAETLALSDLRGYRTGGTIHFIINNQIGFTTAPSYHRFTPHPTDLALAVQAPIFHVNGDDPEAVVHVARIATEFRQKFKRDVVIDMVCYRRFGHNESDEPAFTQPIMYRKIATQPTTREIYARHLVKLGVLKDGEPEQIVAEWNRHLDAQFEAAASYKPNKADWLEGAWQGFRAAHGEDRRGETGVSMDLLQEVGRAITSFPANHNVNRKIVRQLDAKKQMFESGEGLDWATGEALAFGTLVAEGYPVRLSGQDCGRGTFSQRHSVLVDQDTEARYVPLNHVRPGKQATFEVHDSPLAEASVLGFEYGYSLAEPKALVLWEAQFGDFANGAQVLIDQFINSGELKWLRMSGLVMLLPHGWEGQGPEHSSARLERFLQLSADDNWQVCNITTPANYFHALRRQIHRDFRKPLIIMSPKSLLRHKGCVSPLADFAEGSSFHRIILDPSPALKPEGQIRRVVLCSGKVYFDLQAERDKRGIDDVAIMRIEQLFPFPRKPLSEILARYKNAEVVWCQEEPRNQGAYFYVDRVIEWVLEQTELACKRPRYIGRPASASPATGLFKRHNAEQAQLVDEALTPGKYSDALWD